MFDAVYIGDEVAGAGWRLAGVHSVVTDPDGAEDALAAARQEAHLVLIGAGTAAGLDDSTLAAAQRAGVPPVVVVPDVRGNEPPDPATAINRAFGLDQ